MNLTVIISSFISGLLCSMGFGGGSVLLMYLTGIAGIEQKQAQGINLIFFLATGFSGLIVNIKKGLIDKGSWRELIKFALPGMLIGFMLLGLLPSFYLRKIFGVVLLLIGIKSFFNK